MNRVESLFARLFLMLFTLILTLVMIEAAATYYLWNIASQKEFNLYATVNQVKERYGQDFFVSRQRKSDLLYFPHHYLGYIPTPNYESGENRHNSLGFRGEEFSVQKDESTYRIVALGASTTYGTEVENYQHSYPYQLKEFLKAEGYNTVEVINAGVGGYASYENVMNLQFRVLELDPDLVIVYQGLNDIDTRLVYPPEIYHGDNSGHRQPFLQDVKMPSIFEYSNALRIIGINFGWFTSQASIRWTRVSFPPTAYDGIFRRSYRDGVYPEVMVDNIGAMFMLEHNPPEFFRQNSVTIALASQSIGADVLFVTFATSQEFDDVSVSSDVYIQGMQEHNQVTLKIAEFTDSYYYDLASIFPQDKQYYADSRHMTLEGNQLRAQLIGDYIIAEIFPESAD